MGDVVPLNGSKTSLNEESAISSGLTYIPNAIVTQPNTSGFINITSSYNNTKITLNKVPSKLHLTLINDKHVVVCQKCFSEAQIQTLDGLVQTLLEWKLCDCE